MHEAAIVIALLMFEMRWNLSARAHYICRFSAFAAPEIRAVSLSSSPDVNALIGVNFHAMICRVLHIPSKVGINCLRRSQPGFNARSEM